MNTSGKILCKAGNGKSFKLADNNWYTVKENVMPYLAKFNKGDSVELEFEKKGLSSIVSKISKASEAVEEQKPDKTDSQYTCEVCGKTLKDGKYKKCFMCNKKGADAPKTESSSDVKRTYVPDDVKTAQIQRGNALNAAAAVASGQKFDNPSDAAQYVKELACEFLDFLRTEEQK